MSAPQVGPVTADVYELLPELYRTADQAQDVDGAPGWPLLRYLSVLWDQATLVDTLLSRLTFTPRDVARFIERTDTAIAGIAAPWRRFGDGDYGEDTYGDQAAVDVEAGDLVDPARADAGWLPWLAQLLGVPLPADAAAPEQRRLIAAPQDAWARGTPSQIVAAVRRILGPTAYVGIQAGYPDQGDTAAHAPFTIAIVTRREETVEFATWASLQEAAPTWGDLERLPDFSNGQAASSLLAAEPNRPAGFRFEHVYLTD